MPVPKTPTPHIAAKRGEIAPLMLMPGDPKRSEFIAKTYFENSVLVNDVRGVRGYTGEYRGVPVSVMASGMGMPSMALYSYELFAAYGVERIIRVGTAGSLCEEVKPRDLVIAQGACTDSNMAAQYGLPGAFTPIADYLLLRAAADAAERAGASYHVGNVFSTDTYYTEAEAVAPWNKMGVLAVEMEAAALYMNAARLGKKALAICTVSNSLLTGEELPTEERERGFHRMIEVALDCISK